MGSKNRKRQEEGVRTTRRLLLISADADGLDKGGPSTSLFSLTPTQDNRTGTIPNVKCRTGRET